MAYITYHNHDTKSLLDSCLKTKDLVKWAKANKMDSVGVCNHGEMSSHIELYKECIKNEIKPLLGIEFYVTENKLDQEGKKIRDNWHLIAIAKNSTGWHNMIKLHNLSFREERYYYDPRITLNDLFAHKDGLIITSACIGGVLGRPWMDNNLDKSLEIAKQLKQEFGADFYLELQNHNAEDLQEREKQHNYNHYLMRLSKDLGIKCTIQNDSHYYLKSDWVAHQVLLCKNTGSKMSNPKFSFDSHEYYLKNEAEMIEVFDEYPLSFIEECIANTQEIADKVEVYDITNKIYDCPSFGEPEETYKKLVKLTYNGLHEKFTDKFLELHPEYEERVKEELEIVKKVGYVDYFMMLEDLYAFTRKHNIYTGISRGSAGGSLVLYCIGAIAVDPIKYHLLFSRFINVDRISACDVDIDVNDKDRPIVVQYLKDRYGADHVCNIGTYGELTAKASFKAVASVLEIPFEQANSLSSVMDSDLSLQENYDQIAEFKKACDNDEIINRAFNIAKTLEGTFAQRGTHACGLVISSKPLDEDMSCVTVKDTKSKERIVSTAFEMKEVDGDLKKLKLDILGLRNLGILEETDKLIREHGGIPIDFKNLNVNDEKTYKMLSDGYTSMVFQFESQLMQRIIKKVQPKTIEDLSCITALARPGSLDSGLTEQYIRRRNGLEKVTPLVDGTEKYMEDTLQLPIYQENIMQISRVMAKFSGSEADTLRKYIGKKDPVKLKAERKHFVDGATSNGYTEQFANEIFDIFEKFGSYGFNKSHAVGYSLLSYATAYYKANYPHEFTTAVLNSVTDDLDKLNLYIGEAYRMGLAVLPPDINESSNGFTLNDKKQIRFGLNAIKGLGKSAVTNIMNARKHGKFKSITDFIARCDKVDKSNLQALLRVGAFNLIEQNPRKWDLLCEYIGEVKTSKQYLETGDLEQSIYTVVGNKKGRKSEQYTYIAELKRSLKSSKQDQLKKEQYNKELEDVLQKTINDVQLHFSRQENYTVAERINNEQELLGFNITTNPYKRWSTFERFFTANVNNEGLQYVALNTLMEDGINYVDTRVHTVGLLTDIKEFKTKRGGRMAKLTIEFCGAKTSTTVFSRQWENNIEKKIQKGNMVSIVGKLIEADKNYSAEDYELKLESIRQMNVLVNEYSKCEINIDKYDRDRVDFILKHLAYEERQLNLPIEKAVLYKCSKGYLPVCGLCWINNIEELQKRLSQ